MTTSIKIDDIPKNRLGLPETVWWSNEQLFFLDQTQLPNAVVGERQDTIEQVFESIKALKVRGAPAIGVAGAYGLLVGLQPLLGLPLETFLFEIERLASWLGTSRPTAVNLVWGLNRMVAVAQSHPSTSTTDLYSRLVSEAIAIHDEDRSLCQAIGKHGHSLIRPDSGILTHCNAGSLATAEFGTATAPMYVAHQANIPFRVYADETRPLLQGARLTSWELQHAGIDVTLITDNMAAHLMSQGLIDVVIVGTDRVAANGDVANKIGTLGVAVLAKHFGVPFYVALPYSTIDLEIPTGDGIPIEERDDSEVTCFGERRTGPEGIKVRNPAFDVTPHTLVAGLITEHGILRPPFEESLQQIVSKPKNISK